MSILIPVDIEELIVTFNSNIPILRSSTFPREAQNIQPCRDSALSELRLLCATGVDAAGEDSEEETSHESI
jgi:hypothetical protein